MSELMPTNLDPGNSSGFLLQTIRVRFVSTQIVERTTPWFFHPADGMASFYIVLSGRCRIRFEGSETSISLGGGSLAVLLDGGKHWLQNDRQQTERSAVLRGRFTWNSDELASLLPEYPLVVRFEGENEEIVSWAKKFVAAMEDGSPLSSRGSQAGMDELAHTILVRSVRRMLDGNFE